MAFITPAGARIPQDITFEAPNLSLPQGLDASRFTDRAGPVGVDRPADAPAGAGGRERRLRPLPAAGHFAVGRIQNAAGLQHRQCRSQNARSLRAEHVRLELPDCPATGRGRREHGAGEPGQRRNLGHARQRVPALEGLSVSAHRPGRVGAARRSARSGAARNHVDRDGRRDGAHAQDSRPCRSTMPSPAATTGARKPCSSPAAAYAAAP